MKASSFASLVTAIASLGCAPAPQAPSPNAGQPVPVTLVQVPAAAPPSAAAPEPAAADAAAEATIDACEGAALDLDALFDAGQCPLPADLATARTDPELALRVDATVIRVASGGTARVPVVFDNPTSRTLALALRGCDDAGAGPGFGVVGDGGTSARGAPLSRAFSLSAEDDAGTRADEAPGDDVACLSACMPLGVSVKLPPGAHARVDLEYRARMHRWVQCADQDAGPLPAGSYRLVVLPGEKQRATVKLVVH